MSYNTQYDRNMAKLPEVCYAQKAGERRKVVLLKRGETGYWPLNADRDAEFPDEASASKFVHEFNARLEVTPAQREAMINGSIFGCWHTEGADPDNKINQAPKAQKE